MTLRRVKNIALLSGAIAIYGAAGGVYLYERDIHLADYIHMPSLTLIQTASADTATHKSHIDFSNFKSFSAAEDAGTKESEATPALWERLPTIKDIQAYFTFEWPDLPDITVPKLTAPDLSLPQLKWPELPALSMPEIALPAIPFENITLHFFMEGSETIERRGEALTMPTLPSLPNITIPDLEMPRIQMPTFIKEIPFHLHGMVTGIKNTTLWVLDFLTQSAAKTYETATTTIYTATKKLTLKTGALFTAESGAAQLAEIAPAAGIDQPFELAELANENALFRHGVNKDEEETKSEESQGDYRYDIEEETLDVEGVLVPQKATVISSSKDGKIAAIHFDNGEMFRKDDILVEYECKDLKAELEIAEAEKSYTEKRTMRNQKLLKLDIISDIDHLGIKTEDIKAAGQAKIIASRMEQCYIRAAYDGRVTNRLANPHEYTRSDRVLMEVASLDDLEIEFLLPSRWLRWINVGAPLTLNIAETDENYSAVIKRIYGEVDPVSQSIQISAKLDSYESPLLPGMSGNVHLDITAIREAGIKGFLEEPRYSSADIPPAKP